MKDNNYILKPLDCSLCMNFWVGMTYLLITGTFCLPYAAFVCLLSCFSGFLKSTILLVEDILTTGIKLIYKLIDKI